MPAPVTLVRNDPPAAPAPTPSFLPFASSLTVRLLESGTGTWTTELLGFAATVVGDEQRAVVLGQGLLQQVLAVLIDELLVVGDQGLGDRLADGVDLGGVATAADADADVDVGELVEAEDQERLVDLLCRNPVSPFVFPILPIAVSKLRNRLAFLCPNIPDGDWQSIVPCIAESRAQRETEGGR